jgi:hypothetical protein
MSRHALPAAIDVLELNPYAPRPFVFTEICLCLRDSLRRAGVDSQHLHNHVSGDPLRWTLVPVPLAGWQQVVAGLDPARTLLFNLEQLGSDAPGADHAYVRALAGWAVADYNSHNLDWLRQANGCGQVAFELPLVPSPALAFAACEPVAPPSVDVLFYGSLNPRRDQALSALREAGLVVEVVQGAYAWELAPALRRAKLVLHVHFYETRRFPVARMLQPLAAGVPVVCEESVMTDGVPWCNSGIVFSAREHLPAACLALRDDPARRLAQAQAGLRFAASVDFAAALGAGVRATGRQPGLPAPDSDDEALGLAPESHLVPAPAALALRSPGRGPWGRLGALALLAFVAMSLFGHHRR